jgi:hypothetical protein
MKRSSFSRSIALVIVVALFAATVAQLSASTNQAPLSAQVNYGQSATARATASSHGVLVEWTSQFDNQILGFNVVRIVNSQRAKLNPSLIAGPTLIYGARTQSYAWFDLTGTIDSNYEIESVDLRGEVVSRVMAVASRAAALPEFRQSPMLANVDGGKSIQISNADWHEAEKSNSLAAITTDSSPALIQQWALANLAALKIGIRADGWYRITRSQMSVAGFDVSGDAGNLQVFVEGAEIAISVSRASGPLSQDDFIEFWAQGIDQPTTDTRVYWLINGAQPGKRIRTYEEVAPTANPVASVRPVEQVAGVALSPIPFIIGAQPIQEASTKQVTKNSETGRSVKNSSVEGSSSLATPNRLEAANPMTAQRETRADSSQLSPPVRAAAQVDRQAPSVDKAAVAPQPGERSNTNARTLHPTPNRSRVRRRPTRSKRQKHRSRAHNHSIQVNPTPAFTYSTEYKNRSIYYTAALNGDHENFFGPVIAGSSASVTMNTRSIERTSTAPVQLNVALQGASLGAHQINVLVNGTLAGLITFSDTSSTIQTLSFPSAWLIDGDNTIKFVPTSANDVSLLDFARVTYAHSFNAENDALQFSVKSTQTARLEGFTTTDIRVVDVTDPNSVQVIRPIVENSGGTFAATVPGGDRGKARRLIAMSANRISQPAWLLLNQPSTLNQSTNAADFIIIAYKDFIPSLAPLVAQRQAQGYAVKVVDVDDVFDEFSFGEHTPQAIRDLMLLAKNSWTRAPSYLLLFGDASYDPLNHLGVGNFDFVPTKLVDTGTPGTTTALEAACDDWLTDFDGNGIGDIALGRLPVRTVTEANLVVSKIVNYSPANTGNKALLVADTQGSYYFNFEAANDQVATTLPAGMTIQKVYRRLQSSDANARANIIANLNAGQSVTVYSGHGNVDFWGGSIFTGADAAGLNNGNRLSFVVVMDCLNGYFADPSLMSLAESLVLAPNGGAVSSFASSGLTIPDGQHQMGLQMFQLLYTGAPMPIGDASRLAKSATTDMDVRRTWILFGDPTLKIR